MAPASSFIDGSALHQSEPFSALAGVLGTIIQMLEQRATHTIGKHVLAVTLKS